MGHEMREGSAESRLSFYVSQESMGQEMREGCAQQRFRDPGDADHSQFYVPQELSRAWAQPWERISLVFLRVPGECIKIGLFGPLRSIFEASSKYLRNIFGPAE